MGLLAKIFGRRRTLGDLTVRELRQEEILIGRQRDRLMSQIEKIGAEKQRVFGRGAAEKMPEVRKALAAEFELLTQRQLFAARELNLRGKELLTVSRLRLAKENKGTGKAQGRLNLSARDVARIGALLANDAVTQDAYGQKLDAILEVGHQADQDALASTEPGEAGAELLRIWEQMDRGMVAAQGAFDQADSAVRRRAAASDQ